MPGATQARVRVEEAGAAVTVTVEDDGRGFDAAASNQGFGLLGMRERVALSGGELSVESSSQGGVRVTATLPVERVGQDGAPG